VEQGRASSCLMPCDLRTIFSSLELAVELKSKNRSSRAVNTIESSQFVERTYYE
jgi:hypothetical protein